MPHLDLGCLDGMFSIEFALQGADTIGVEIREANIKKAIFCEEVLNLQNLDFRRKNVRNISIGSNGRFDAIICSGILYYLPSVDAINLIRTMYEMAYRLVVTDTHVALEPIGRVFSKDDAYWGDMLRERPDNARSGGESEEPLGLGR